MSGNESAVPLPLCCYLHEDGNPEPLFAIWSQPALQRLKENAMQRKKTGPCFTIKQIQAEYNPVKPNDKELSTEKQLHESRKESESESCKSSRGGILQQGEKRHDGESGVGEMSKRELNSETQKPTHRGGSESSSSWVGYVVPADSQWLFNTNTPEQWQTALSIVSSSASTS